MTDEKMQRGVSRVAEAVIANAAAAFLIGRDRILSTQRDKPVVRARWACYRVLFDNHGWSMPRIAKYFGGQDHTSILHGLRRSAEIMEVNEKYRDLVAQCANGVAPVAPKTSDGKISMLDHIVVDRLLSVTRGKMQAALRENPDAFRARYAKTYEHIKGAL